VAQEYDLLPKTNFSNGIIEKDSIFQKKIVGNEDSAIAGLIKKLNNSDWVKQGIEYIPQEFSNEAEICPFCQQKTITRALANEIRSYFNEEYEKNIDFLKHLLSDYERGIDSLPNKDIYEKNGFLAEEDGNLNKLLNLYNSLKNCLDNNKNKIQEKLQSPSQVIELIDSRKHLDSFNQFVKEINVKINKHNLKVVDRDVYLDNVKKQFWEIMRWDYDFLLSKYQQKSEYINRKIEDLDNNIKSIDQEIKGKENEREEERKKTRNIEEAIAHINQNLLELGIDGFKIEKCDKTKYRLVRNAGESEDIFRSLSEGEKMIISFLYFKEFCEGNERDSSSTDKKIIVIDDPISSLSHIYVFSVGRMIYKYFFKNNKYEQFFVLTHSLYFFYELADRKKERRRKNQKLFRITKDSKGSQVEDMKYEEIQNDYQSYWSVIKDAKQPPALIANCMRNIIEYFFNFTENIALNDLFQKKPLDGIKYQAFSRFINRESHSEGQNIFDLKEFDYNDFKEAFRLVFEQNGYKNHYDKMMK
jgi:wobble nucleotide-excising tRNase